MRYHPGSAFQRLYDEAALPLRVRQCLRSMLCSCACGNMFNVITTGAAFTGFTEYLGANDLLFGVLMATPYIGTLVQLPMSLLIARTGRRKKYLLLFGLIARSLWLVIALVPYFVPSSPPLLRIWTVVLLYAISAASGSAIGVGFTPWIADFVPLEIRGRWLGMRIRIESIVSMAVGLGIAWLLDTLPAQTAYTLVLVFGALIGTLDISLYFGVDQPKLPVDRDARLLPIIRRVLKNRPFTRLLVFWTAFNFSVMLSSPYFLRYSLVELHLTFVEATFCFQILAAVVSVLFTGYWGRMADRFGSKPVLWVTHLGCALLTFLWVFSEPNSLWVPIVFHLIGAAVWCCRVMLNTNMLLYATTPEDRSVSLALGTAVTNVLGSFLGILAGSALLNALRGIVVPGGMLDAYQWLFVIAGGVQLLIMLVFVPPLTNENNRTLRDFFQSAQRNGR